MGINPSKLIKFIIGVLSLLVTFLGDSDSNAPSTNDSSK